MDMITLFLMNFANGQMNLLRGDSLFNDLIFNVAVFFCYCVFALRKKTIILTATKQPVDFFIKAIDKTFKKVYESNGMVKLDLLKVCDYVLPERIRIIAKNKSKNKIIDDLLNLGEKIIYFMNFVGDKPSKNKDNGYTIFQEYDHLIDYGLREDEIAVIVSKSAQKQWDEQHNCEKIKESSIYTDNNGNFIKLTFNEWVREEISIKNEIPDGIKVVLCSATLNEGISIDNKTENPFKYVFTDAHYISTLIQQMGRLRNNIDEFLVINDARQHYNYNDEIEYNLDVSQLNETDTFLNYLTNYAECISDYEKRYEFVDWICKDKGFNLLVYSYITHRFEFNNLKYNMRNEVNRVEEKYNLTDFDAKHIWEKEISEFAKIHGIYFESSRINRDLNLLIEHAKIKKHIESVIGKKFKAEEWKKEQQILTELKLGATEKKVNKTLRKEGISYQLNKNKAQGKYTYWFSNYKSKV